MSALDVAGELMDRGIQLRSYGEGQHRAICPWCAATRRPGNQRKRELSVMIDEKGAAWSCKHCGEEDGVVLKTDARSKPKPREYKPVPGYNPVPSAEIVRFFKDRGIGTEALRRRRVGEGGGNRTGMIAFPIFANPQAKNPLNMKYRSPCDRKDGAKFTQDRGGEQIYYGLDRLDDGEEVVIVEGELDALACEEARIPNVISVPDGFPDKMPQNEDSAFPYVTNCWEVFKHKRKVILATDKDGPGEIGREVLARRYGRDRCWLVEWPDGCKDPNDVLMQLGPDALVNVIRAAKPYPIQSLVQADDYRDKVVDLFRIGRQRGVSTGYKPLDEYFTLRRRELTVVTGIPGHGKSELIDQIAVNVSRGQRWHWGVCSFENPVDEHLAKLTEKYTMRPFWDAAHGRMSEGELHEAMDWVGEHFHFIRFDSMDAPAPTIDAVLEGARALVGRYGIKGNIIDPYNELSRPADLVGVPEHEYISQLLSRIKRFNAISDCHTFLVAHPQKLQRDKNTGEYPVPSLYDISGGAHWLNKMDNGVVVHRDDDLVRVFIKKIRFKATGEVGECALAYDKRIGTYFEV